MMGRTLQKPGLRPFLPQDLPVLAAIFSASIEEIAAEDYSGDQIAAWAAQADGAGFAARLANQLTLVATLDHAPIAFASLRDNDHIDMLYVHPGAARQGVATALCDALEKIAAVRGVRQLTVDASDTALPLFEGRGYVAVRRNMVELGGEWFGNTSMQKNLAPAGGSERS
jgi:putative acetyltransferase